MVSAENLRALREWSPYRLVTLEELMELFDAGTLLAEVAGLTNYAHSNSTMERAGLAVLHTSNHEYQKRQITFVCAETRRLGLRSSRTSADTLRGIIFDEARPYTGAVPSGVHGDYVAYDGMARGRFMNYARDLLNRISDELSSRIVMTIPLDAEDYYRQEEPLFGKAVDEAFQDAREDIGEAGKCYALGRFTAAVFHLGRAMESAVQVLAIKLGATTTDEHGRTLAWGIIAANIKGIIDKTIPKGSDAQVRWYRVQAHLESMNRAWRAPTAHPKQTYTPEEARNVFDAARSFMQEVAGFA